MKRMYILVWMYPEQKQIRVEVSLIKDNEWDDPVILFDGLSLYK